MKNNWTIKRLDEVATVTMGQSPSSSSYNTSGQGVPFLQGKPPVVDTMGAAVVNQWTTEPTKVVEAGTALMTVRAPVGELFTTNNQLCLGRGLAGIKANDDVSQDYLNYYLQFSKDKLDSFSQGSTFTAINSSDLKGIQISLPEYYVQEKLATGLLDLDRQIAKTEQIIQKVEQIKQGLMQRLFNVKNNKVDVSTIENLGKFKRGPFGGALKKEIFVDEGFKVYEQKNAIYNDFSLGSYFIDSEKFEQMKGFALESGDIIISCSGTLGKVAIVPAKFQRGIINQALLKISPSKEWDVLYVKYLLESSYVQERFIQVAPGSAMKNMASIKTIKSTKIIKPLLDEQQRIAKIISEVDSKLLVELNYKKTLLTIKDGLMRDIFNQKVQVN